MIKIGHVDVSLERRQLYLKGEPLHVGTRAFDILEVLIKAGGNLVSKEEILRRVWPETIVEESNLQVHISLLRKLLGDDRGFIKTIPGRGYLLACPDEIEGRTGTRRSKSANEESLPLSNVPPGHMPLIGREKALGDVKSALDAAPLVTLVGAGGIGKTQLGLEAARSLISLYTEVRYVNLSTVERPESTLNAIAEGLAGGRSKGVVTVACLIQAIGCRKTLIMLDNCEHVIQEVASICEQLVESNPNLTILATSREPLRARFERIYRVPPLEVPSEDAERDDILRCSAVDMFVSRAHVYAPYFRADGESTALIGTICRRLDGLPLALELAAARVAALGISELVAQLDQRFCVLTGGPRTAPARQRTLKAALDWSYQFLCQQERTVLRRISVFRGAFHLNAACEVAALEDLCATDITEAIAGLVSKSLLMFAPSGSLMTYHLFETTRAYALQMLVESGESEIVVRRYEYFQSTRGAVTDESNTTATLYDQTSLALQDG
ncbi:ATP-binding protein [Paraburkholderia sp. SIMBA_030]|uniref:ATP-binding protein n=1 Tax=Paraburkholderia sp. SIMBA_030 TaxID=3085773 RepID=UPI0039787FDD